MIRFKRGYNKYIDLGIRILGFLILLKVLLHFGIEATLFATGILIILYGFAMNIVGDIDGRN